MRAYALLLTVFFSASSQAAVVLNHDPDSVAQSIFHAKGPDSYFTRTRDRIAHTERTGRAVLSDDFSTLSLIDIGFTRPEHTLRFTNQTVTAEITVFEQRWEMSDQTRNVIENIGETFRTESFNYTDFTASADFAGTYKLTGFNGTVVEGDFNFGSTPLTWAFGSEWEVLGRSSNPIVGDVTGLKGQAAVSLANWGTVYEGTLDGVPWKLESHNQTNVFGLSSSFTSAVPEPSSAALLLLAAGGMVLRRRRG